MKYYPEDTACMDITPLQREIHSSVVFELEYHVMGGNSVINSLVTWYKTSFLIGQFTVEV